jgi:hypothetical protein
VQPQRHQRPGHDQAANSSSAPHTARAHPDMPAAIHPHTTAHRSTPSTLTPGKIARPAPDGNPRTAQHRHHQDVILSWPSAVVTQA